MPVTKAEDWAMDMPPPPEGIRMRWLEVLERLAVEWRTVIGLPPAERRYCRNIVRWIMAERGARRSLPTGYIVQAWPADRNGNSIVLVRTR